MKVAIYNDCDTDRYKHFGCELVMETFRNQLDRVGCELIGTVTKDEASKGKRAYEKTVLDPADLVIVNGEGSFHHNRRNDIYDVGERWPSILINTLFQDNNHGERLKSFKYISCRESFSAREASKASGLTIDTIPDVIFTNERLRKLKLNPVKEHVHVGHFSAGDLSTRNTSKVFLENINQYESTTSISYHSLIISIMLGQTIKEVLKANTHKNQALIHDMNQASSREEYIASSQEKINTLFEKIHEY